MLRAILSCSLAFCLLLTGGLNASRREPCQREPSLGYSLSTVMIIVGQYRLCCMLGVLGVVLMGVCGDVGVLICCGSCYTTILLFLWCVCGGVSLFWGG